MSLINDVIRESGIRAHYLTDEARAAFGLLQKKQMGEGYAIRMEEDGAAKCCILIDAEAGKHEARYIAAHELGHILLGHLRGPEMPRYAEEEAGVFAAVLTAFDLIADMCRAEGVLKREVIA